MTWDDDLHGPIFGAEDPSCTFVLVHKCDPTPGSDDERVLVNAVGVHVEQGTNIAFKLNDNETCCFGFKEINVCIFFN